MAQEIQGSESTKEIKIAFFGKLSKRFINIDYDILSKYFDVRVIEPPRNRREWISYPKKVKKLVRESDMVFGWFAGWHTAPAVHYAEKYSKPSVIVVGGYDAAYVPEIDFGAFTNIKEKIPAKYIYKNATKILVVDLSLKADIIKNAKVNGSNIDYLPTGYDSNYWKPGGKKEKIVLTVGIIREAVVKRKGFETFVKAARYLPDVKFVLVGKHADKSIDYLKKIASNNVEFPGFVSDDELLKYYQRAKVYCQLSRYEGLPNALCEAMLCGCIPVGTRYCGIPTAIGDTGFYVPYGDEKATAEAIKKALAAPEEMRKKARERIKNLFPIEKREKKLVEILCSLKQGVQ